MQHVSEGTLKGKVTGPNSLEQKKGTLGQKACGASGKYGFFREVKVKTAACFLRYFSLSAARK